MCSKEHVKIAYFAYFHNVISYGIIFWGSYKSNLQKIFKIQKHAIRIITNSPRKSSCRNLFKELNILPVPCILIFHCLLYVRKNITLFQRNLDVHTYSTRTRNDLHIDRKNKTISLRNLHCLGIRLYNKIPIDIKESKTTILFKKKVKKLLLQKCFYSIEEFTEQGF